MSTFIKLVKNPLGLIGLLLLIFFGMVALLAPTLAPPERPHEPYRIPRDGYRAEPQPPNPKHPFGTTQGQHDIYYGCVWGARTAWFVSLVVVGLSVVIGVTIGAISAFYGRWLDEVVMRITDIFYAFPFLVAAMTLAAILGHGVSSAIAALVAFSWMGYARLSRGEVLRIREMDYIQAARALGVPPWRLIFRHILPNAIWPVFVTATMNMGSIVITFAALSFLGVGVPQGYADWGQMISYARNWIIGLHGKPLAYWYTVIYPGAAITLFCLAWNLVGDALRDILDPRLRGRISV
ncbi:TPA: ABC transporter permease [Candidatus Bipolaricaulota bacterium]|nr:ABC transporter permease [Candidatus Bipolaricaulota bacterium]